MKTHGEEMIGVDPTPIDAEGNKLEPEERIATEAVEIPVEAHLADHAVAPNQDSDDRIGTMRGLVGVQTSAGDVAQATATRCQLCAYWRHEDWRKHLAAIADTVNGQREIDAFRGELLGRNFDPAKIDEYDFIAVNLAIQREFGICVTFTETKNDVTLTPYYGGCPEDDVRFKIRDRESGKLASVGYDRILRLAQGRES